jgi:hypothetical protein
MSQLREETSGCSSAFPSAAASYISPVYSTCLFCTKDLGTNEVIETLPIGRRLAFDAAQGRLWVICRSCGRWNLVPFDTRLETIDACERLFRDTRTRYSTDHIGIARVREGLELVRIGPALRPEFASWRYGAQYRQRRRQTLLVAGGGAVVGLSLSIGLSVVAGASGMIGGAGIVGGTLGQLPRMGWNFVRRRRQRVVTQVEGANRPVILDSSRLGTANLVFDNEGVALQFRTLFGGPVQVPGAAGRHLARKVVSALNDVVGSKRHLDRALGRLTSGNLVDWLEAKSSESLPKMYGADGRRIWRHAKDWGPRLVNLKALEPSDRLAVEMWLSEEDEARALAGELALLERQWQEAEQLAKIADALALPEEVNREEGKRQSS